MRMMPSAPAPAPAPMPKFTPIARPKVHTPHTPIPSAMSPNAPSFPASLLLLCRSAFVVTRCSA
ncbi:hypothetical protein E2C01_085132 [Portunus trituberculatus]|uniref:Uncharacterized protein n=1 Tax=Portunus trituberculatus TaxID=210409 RepID=A0A5B7J5Y5_PORTR|nr:hypothetical protein [Portunus trituberculatus]